MKFKTGDLVGVTHCVGPEGDEYFQNWLNSAPLGIGKILGTSNNYYLVLPILENGRIPFEFYEKELILMSSKEI